MCCQGVDVCILGSKCCPRSCCPQEGRCGSDGFCSTLRVTVTTTSTRTTSTRTTQITTTTETTQTTTTKTTTTTTSSFTSGPCRTASPRELQARDDGTGLAYLDFEETGLESRDLEERQRYPFEKFCTRACHIATGEEVIVLNLKRIQGQTDQLIDSTCRGMRARRNAGQIPDGLKDGEDILKYNGGGKQNRVTSVKCDDFCVEANQHVGPNSYQCDEYPPASWNQAENAQTALCIERYQNSGTQGPILQKITKYCKPNEGDKMLIRVEGGCGGARAKREDEPEYFPFPALMPRQEDSTSLTISSSNATLRDPMGDGSLTYVAVDLGELDDGHYDLEVNLDGPVTNVTVLEADGETYAQVDSPSDGPVKLSWDVDSQGAYLAFAVIAFTEEAVEVSYTGNFTPSSTSDSSGPEDTGAASYLQAWSPAGLLVTLLALFFA
ncbi:uncharacterized protein BJX67DRAFT_352169 [Aspergillus lucknowensis]|uniref:Deoxyribonuclease NucA/NucB domain-containing protein n=1 Tax=Aspergillus lucknowensis TaxID=176173 RepID=A0ABR4LT94_9EURO